MRAGLVMVLIAATVVFEAYGADAPPCEQAVLERVRFLEGVWQIQSRSRLTANPLTWEEVPAASRVDVHMRGCMLIERVVSTRRGQPLEMMRIFTARPRGEGLQLAFADSEHGPMYVYESEPSDPLTFRTQLATQSGAVWIRTRITEVSQDRFVFWSERSVDGERWDLTGRAEYRRAVTTR